MLARLQGYREADSLDLGLGKEMSLRYRVKMSKGMNSGPNVGLTQHCCVLLGFQEMLL